MEQSRFWAGSSSSDNESSDSDSSGSSDSSNNAGNFGNANRWQFSDDSSDESTTQRVVQSAAQRFRDSLDKQLQEIRKYMKATDFVEVQSAFDALSKLLVKHKQLLNQGGVPRALVKTLVQLEDFTKESLADKEAFRSLAPRQGRALNRMKLTLRKHNKAYASVMEVYRQAPDEDDDEDDDEEDAESDAESSKSSASSSSSSSSDSDSSSDDDSDDSDGSTSDEDDWNSDSSSSSSSDEEDPGMQLKGRARWLKKVPTNTGPSEEDIRRKEERQAAREIAKANAAAAAAEQQAAAAARKSVLPLESLSVSVIQRRVAELAASRRAKDLRAQLQELEGIARLSVQFGPRVEIPVWMYVISAQFGLQRTLDDVMDTATWQSCAGYLERIAAVLDDGYKVTQEHVDTSDIVLAKRKDVDATTEQLKNPTTGEVETVDERAERERLEKEAEMTEEELKEIPVVGSLSLHLSRLEEEYVKSLQRLPNHTAVYHDRVRDERRLVKLLERYQAHFQKTEDVEAAAKLAQLRIEHLYYRHDVIAMERDAVSEMHSTFGDPGMWHPACQGEDSSEVKEDWSLVHPGAALGTPTAEMKGEQSSETLISELCKFVYKHGTSKAKKRAVICQVFHHALHDRFVRARDLLLMSHLQETIYDEEVSTMVLFNRMMVTLGMSAFRLGRIHDAHQCLYDICSGRVRELLAQGMNTSRFSDKSAEQEKAEKRRLIPNHQHIDLDMLEACHLISAMLLEVPNLAGTIDGEGGNRRHRVISRTFRKYQDQYNHQAFSGPPEQTRDYVMQAAKALMKGDWKTCVKLVMDMDVWVLLPGKDAAAEKIRDMLTKKIKLEGLRTYLFAFSAQYDSLSLSQLCGMFEMTKNEVHCVVSKMIINREFFATWDQPTESIVLRKVEPTPLQLAALNFAEKASVLLEANERLLEAQSGIYKDEHHRDWKGDRDDRWNRRGGPNNNNSNNNNNNRGGDQNRYNHRKSGGGRGGRGGGQGRGRGRGRQGRGGQPRGMVRFQSS